MRHTENAGVEEVAAAEVVVLADEKGHTPAPVEARGTSGGGRARERER